MFWFVRKHPTLRVLIKVFLLPDPPTRAVAVCDLSGSAGSAHLGTQVKARAHLGTDDYLFPLC